jgi:hypothetical protein
MYAFGEKKEITEWGLFNGEMLGNMLISQGLLQEKLDVKGEVLVEERTEAIAAELSLC